VKAGYRGPIYCDAATRELCQLLLLDSAHLQEEDAKYAAKKKYSSHANPLPLYSTPDAQAALNQFKEIPRSDSFTISPEFSVRTHDAGHILGSCWLELTINENRKQTVIVFSGDVGRYDQPILNDPTPPSRADFLLCESTYGDRDHPSGSVADALADAINRVAKRGGAVVIPSFAVGRTQTLMWYLRQLDEAKRIPQIPVYVDSPMAISVTGIYAKHGEDHDLDFSNAEQQGNKDPLNLREVKMTRTVDESKAINNVASCVIISASGMATGGRILHHLAQRLPDAKNAVLLVGYQGEGTNGRALQEGAQYLRIHGQEVKVNAEVVTIDQLSAHAGRSELLRWLSGFTAAPKQTFLVHGEPVALESFRAAVTNRLHWPVTVPAYLQSFDLNP
jgi:metallo-beta-lactamase family protein